MKHIGIIAHSTEGAAFCFRSISQFGQSVLGEYMHPDVTMTAIAMGHSMPDWEQGNLGPIAARLLASAGRLKAAGADFFVLPDNTAHIALDTIIDELPLPALHIAEVVCDQAVASGYRGLGILGTKYTMDGPVYRNALARRGIDHTVPPEELREEINRIIFDELVHGTFTAQCRAFYVEQIEALAAKGCDAVVLGCTEIPLLVSPADTKIPLLDSTRLLARAAVAHAIGRSPESIPWPGAEIS